MNKNQFERLRWRAALGLLLIPAAAFAAATHQRRSAIPADRIEVIAHLALDHTSVTNVKTSEHWRRQFLELQDPTRRLVTLVDVTDAAHPAIVKELRLPAGAADSTVDACSGTLHSRAWRCILLRAKTESTRLSERLELATLDHFKEERPCDI
jgi:hypothetical protein